MNTSPLFDAEIIQRQYTFDVSGPGPGDWPEWPKAKEAQPWDLELGVKLALEYQGTFEEKILERMPFVDGIMSQEEALFWLSLLGDADFLFNQLKEAKAKCDEAWIRKQCTVLTPDNVAHMLEHDEMFSSEMVDPTSVMVRVIRGALPYLEGLRLLLGVAGDSYDMEEWFPSFGPPPKEHREQASAMVDQYLESQIEEYATDAWEMQMLLDQILHVIPSPKSLRQVLDNMIEYPDDDDVWSSEVAACFFHHPDKEKVVKLLELYKTYRSGKDVALFLRHFGFSNMPLFFDAVMDFSGRNSSNHRALLTALIQVDAPEFVERFHKLSNKVKFSKLIEEYLLRDNASQTAGLLAMCERRGKKRQWALDYLERRLASLEGEKERVEALKPLCAKSVQKLIDEELFAEAESMPELPKKEWASWMTTLALGPQELGNVTQFGALYETLNLSLIPQPRVKGQQATAFPLAVLIGILKTQLDGKEAPKAKRDALDALSREALAKCVDLVEFEGFVLTLFEHWRKNNGKVSEGWFMPLLVKFGDTLTINSLASFIREGRTWEERYDQVQNCEFCIKALASFQNAGAMQALHERATHEGNATVKERAIELIKAFKQKAKLSEEEFQDFIVPDFGLNEHGKRTFDYGPRQVTMVVRGRQDIVFESTEGKTYTNIPPIRQSDERRLAVAAKEQYKLISKPLREVLSAQNRRFEDAMIAQKLWRFDVWERSIGGHPLLAHIARRIVWSVYDEKDNFIDCVIADEDGSFVNLEMDAVHIMPKHKLTPTHPLDLDEPTRQAWLEQLVDFEIIQPFEQMTRPLYSVTKGTLEVLKRVKKGNLMDASEMMKLRHSAWLLVFKKEEVVSKKIAISRAKTGRFSFEIAVPFYFIDETHTRLSMASWDTSITKFTWKGVPRKMTQKSFREVDPVLFSEFMIYLKNTMRVDLESILLLQ